MSDVEHEDDHPLVKKPADDAVVAHPVLPILAKLRALKCSPQLPAIV
jgi:hypothetical protein